MSEFNQIVEILKRNCSTVSLRRLDDAKEILEATFIVDFSSFEDLEKTRTELNKLSKSIQISFNDNKGVF